MTLIVRTSVPTPTPKWPSKKNDRKSGFAAVVAARKFTDGAGRGIPEKRAVLGFAVVIARCSKAEGARKDQKRRRKSPPVVPRIDERRIERREIRAPGIELIFKRAESGVNPETTKGYEDGEDLNPPSVAAQSTAKPGFRHKCRGTSHSMTSGVVVA